MILASPLWLLALIPWSGVALWMLIGRNPRVAVPFIELWNDSDAPKRRASRAIQRPPVAMACALLAMLLALVAAARPAIVRGRQPLRVLVDRGVTMGSPQAVERVLSQLGRSDVIDVPEG